MSFLVLVRHGLSDYNKQGLWTGWDNPPLAQEGFEEARKTAEALKDIKFDYAYSSDQIRSVQTLEEVLKVLNQPRSNRGQDLSIVQNEALRERNYGVYTKRNKWEVKKELGVEEFKKLRRGWDYPVPKGESLRQVYEREIPYFQSEIEPKLKSGSNIIIGSSGNTIRALIKKIEEIPDDRISDVEIGTGEAYVYEIDAQGKVVSKQIRGQNINRGRV